ncbi:MAG: hypothetical protein M0C28_44380 [Candidatus Moduliflexus flocculans]|nr:hypothetical protein [Candidatus Moduliflexus flocculans]
MTGLEFKPHPAAQLSRRTTWLPTCIGFRQPRRTRLLWHRGKIRQPAGRQPGAGSGSRPTPTRPLKFRSVPNGTTLVLTINRDLQAAGREHPRRIARSTYGAESGTIVVMDPRNGEILAMAATPRMDLNQLLELLPASTTTPVSTTRSIGHGLRAGLGGQDPDHGCRAR